MKLHDKDIYQGIGLLAKRIILFAYDLENNFSAMP